MNPQPLTVPVQDAWKLPTKRGASERNGWWESPYVLRLEGDKTKRRVYMQTAGGTPLVKVYSINIKGQVYTLDGEQFAKVERLAARGLW